MGAGWNDRSEGGRKRTRGVNDCCKCESGLDAGRVSWFVTRKSRLPLKGEGDSPLFGTMKPVAARVRGWS